jgi:hypothetical protein
LGSNDTVRPIRSPAVFVPVTGVVKPTMAAEAVRGVITTLHSTIVTTRGSARLVTPSPFTFVRRIDRELSPLRKTSITVGDDLYFRKAFV